MPIKKEFQIGEFFDVNVNSCGIEWKTRIKIEDIKDNLFIVSGWDEYVFAVTRQFLEAIRLDEEPVLKAGEDKTFVSSSLTASARGQQWY